MILAGIDIGTNTLRLLIADVGPETFREIHSLRTITRLGERLHRTGRLSREARDRSISVLKDFSTCIELHSAAAVSAVGTSALRNAENTPDFVADVRRMTGLPVRVVSGEEEARLTLLGVARALRGDAFSEPCAVVIDVGGGSTEIIAPGPSPAAVSLPLGAVYLTERFISNDPPSTEELGRLRERIRKELDNSPAVPVRAGTELAGTAGTVTTLAAIDQQLAEYDPDRINRFTLARGSIDRIVAKLAGTSLKERREIPGLERGREDIILAGAVVIQEIMERYRFERMLVSDWGLREGIVLDLYDKHRKET